MVLTQDLNIWDFICSECGRRHVLFEFVPTRCRRCGEWILWSREENGAVLVDGTERKDKNAVGEAKTN
jgi:DNA-directed RNA polymerase subunit RPC12/RpoP